MTANGNGDGGSGVKLLVPAELAQAILNYLQERPFKDVSGMIAALVQCGAPHECAPHVEALAE